jgi:TPR repeat protein
MRNLLLILLFVCGVSGQVWAFGKQEFIILKEKAERGDSKAQLMLGNRYTFKGDPFDYGIQQNYAVAFHWIIKSAAQGNYEAQRYIAQFYKKGIGTAEDFSKYCEWSVRAYSSGYRNGPYGGDSIPSECSTYPIPNKADKLTLSPAEMTLLMVDPEQSNAISQFEYGQLYFDGQKIIQSYSEAFKWFKKSADQDYPDSQYFLGVIYYHGKSVPQNNEEAYLWLSLSLIRNGASNNCNYCKDAAILISKISDILGSTQIAKIQKRAKEWKLLVTQVKQ